MDLAISKWLGSSADLLNFSGSPFFSQQDQRNPRTRDPKQLNNAKPCGVTGGKSPEPCTLKIILTHDVDWPPSGPGLKHILARRERFDEDLISKVVKEGYNPYSNITDLMAIEEKYGAKSTFFFRPNYDDGTHVDAYTEIIRNLVMGGWEVGVHINDASTVDSIRMEKDAVEHATGTMIYGSRVHYLKIRPDHLSLIDETGLRYDSSVTFSRNAIDIKNIGYFYVGKLVVFPITIMDAYLFSYMRIPEDRIIEVINKAVMLAIDKGFMTLLWHDSSLKMRGGRMYPSILEFLTSKKNIELVRGIDAYNSVVRSAQS
jgi:peptidoglycan/xylan/chitin deacetylase (PgdA/CDA1 family)